MKTMRCLLSTMLFLLFNKLSDGSSENVTCTCGVGQYIVKNCTATDNAVCTSCSTCSYLLQKEIKKCTTTSNTICGCPSRTYPDHNFLVCKKCTRCKHGFGVVSPCGERDTVCKRCPKGTFSNKKSLTQTCTRCKSCPGGYLQNCTYFVDAVCLPKFDLRQDGDKEVPSVAPTTKLNIFAESTQSIESTNAARIVSTSKNSVWIWMIVAVSVSVLVLVVIAVVVYICRYRLKRKSFWDHSAPIRERRSNTHDSTSTNETFVDENNIHISQVSSSYVDDIAVLLNFGAWKKLAGKLNFTMIDISNMEINTDSPVHKLIQTWQCNENATVYKLYKELMALNYEVAANKLLPLLMPQEVV